MPMKDINYNEIVKKTTNISIIVNIVLSIFKFTVGFFTHSLSLVSDGIHSLSDLFTDLIVLGGVKIASKPPDKDHHFGHGKYETFAGLLLAFFLFLAGFCIVAYGLRDIYAHNEKKFHPAIIFVALISVISKEKLFRWTKTYAIKFTSQVLLANAWHHRTDAFSSVAVVIGAFFSFFGFNYADSITGVAVGIIILATSIKLLKDAFLELSEVSPGKVFEDKIQNILEKNVNIISFHNLRLRKMGQQFFMDMHVMVDENLSFRESHDISEKIETDIKNELGKNTSIVVHVEPCIKQHY